MDEVAIVKDYLLIDDYLNLDWSNPSGISNLLGYWKFNEGTGTTLADNSSNSNNGTSTNMDSSDDWVTSGSETKPSFQ